MAAAARPSKPTVTVVVRNLPSSTTVAQLRSLGQNFGPVEEVEIPPRVANFTRFIYGFIRYASLDVALNAVMRLNNLVLQGRQLSAELGRKHWRNTNDKTVLHDAFRSDHDSDAEEPELSEEELNTMIFQLCHQQWVQHCRNNRGRDLPSFHQIMDMLSELYCDKCEEEITQIDAVALPEFKDCSSANGGYVYKSL